MTTAPIDAEELEALRELLRVVRVAISNPEDEALVVQTKKDAAAVVRRLDAIRARAKQAEAKCTCPTTVRVQRILSDCPLHGTRAERE